MQLLSKLESENNGPPKNVYNSFSKLPCKTASDVGDFTSETDAHCAHHGQINTISNHRKLNRFKENKLKDCTVSENLYSNLFLISKGNCRIFPRYKTKGRMNVE